MFSAQKMAKLSHIVHCWDAAPPMPIEIGSAVTQNESGPEQRADDPEQRQAADPGLDPEPAAGDARPHEGRQVRAVGPERGTGDDRERDAVLRARMADQQHRDQDDDVGEEHHEMTWYQAIP